MEKGKFGDNDYKYFITSNGREAITLFKVGQIVQQIAINELVVHGEKIKKYKNFFFERFITGTFKMAKEGKDWSDPDSKDDIIKLCKSVMLSTENIEDGLKRFDYQRKDVKEYIRSLGLIKEIDNGNKQNLQHGLFNWTSKNTK